MAIGNWQLLKLSETNSQLRSLMVHEVVGDKKHDDGKKKDAEQYVR